jgi:formamidopyrimidine-DNA glycosylase
MPELPELAAHAERLTVSHRDAVLERFEPLSFTALKTVDPPPEVTVGRKLDRVDRRGKYLLLRFGDVAHVVHLMQGGRLAVDERGARRPKQGVARWHWSDDHRPLILTEGGTERRAGVWVVAGDPADQPPLDGLGPEADALDAAELAERLAAKPMRLHGFLRDQSAVAGLGRRLANEICHRAGRSPFARTADLVNAAPELLAAIVEAVADEFEDERAQDRMRRAGERRTRVHGRAGEPCPVCGDMVRAIEYRDYTVFYCARCQTGGKVLSDNALSRLGVPREAQGTRRRKRA